MADPRSSSVRVPDRSATATRNSSERRMVRAASTADCGSSLRPAADLIRRSTSSRERGWSPAESPRNCTHSGACSSRSAANRLRARVWASRSAAEPSSRSSRRYQCVEPSSSLILRKASSPASGSASSANQPSITGSSWRWIAARRLRPPVSASRWRSAPRGSRKPNAESRSRAASGVRRTSESDSRATAESSGSVEDPLVQAAHLALLRAPLGDDGLRGRGAVAERAAEPAQVALGGRHEVGAPQPEQLDAVLERAQQPVCRAERRGVLAPHVAAGGQGRERRRGSCRCAATRRRDRARAGAAAPRTRRRAARRRRA